MALFWVKRTGVATFAAVALVGAAEPPRDKPWSGVVTPGSGWLKRQGLVESYPIRFAMDAEGKATGSFQVTGAYPSHSGKAVLTGYRDADGAAYYLAATIEGRPDLPAAVRAQAEIKVTLTGFDEDDGSLQGVGTLDMADFACLTDPARAAGGETCARRKVPVRWTAKK